MTVIPHTYFDTTHPRTRLRISGYGSLFFVILAVTFLLRFDGRQFNTIFYDEAIYATLGREILAGDYSQQPIIWTYGSVLYPAVSAIADNLGGYTALRLLSAFLSTFSAAMVFAIGWRMFGTKAALWGLVLFAVAGPSISLGQFAVYDSLGVALLSAALWALVESAYNPRWQVYLLLITACCASLSVLSKYIGILFLPPLFMVGLIVYLARGRSILPLITLLLLPIAYILTQYAVMNFDGLARMFNELRNITHAGLETWAIIQELVYEAGPLLALGIISALLIPFAPFNRTQMPLLVRGLLLLVLPLLMASLLVAPFYHLLTGTVQALWKHMVYLLVFCAPLAGYFMATLVQQLSLPHRKFGRLLRFSWALVTLVTLLWYLNDSLARNWGWQRSWPDVTNALDYLRTQPLRRESRVLAEQSAIYEYYFDLGAFDRQVWTNTFFMQYSNLEGVEAMVTSIQDQYFDLVILDDYYTAETNRLLEAALLQNGYTLTYQDPQPQVLTTGQTIVIRIYQLEEARDVQTLSTTFPILPDPFGIGAQSLLAD